ncbi:MAG: hypothetical protein AAB942_00365 [Patescibacteria group bacterium]
MNYLSETSLGNLDGRMPQPLPPQNLPSDQGEKISKFNTFDKRFQNLIADVYKVKGESEKVDARSRLRGFVAEEIARASIQMFDFVRDCRQASEEDDKKRKVDFWIHTQTGETIGAQFTLGSGFHKRSDQIVDRASYITMQNGRAAEQTVPVIFLADVPLMEDMVEKYIKASRTVARTFDGKRIIYKAANPEQFIIDYERKSLRERGGVKITPRDIMMAKVLYGYDCYLKKQRPQTFAYEMKIFWDNFIRYQPNFPIKREDLALFTNLKQKH